ncbi:MAG: hypothetical protein KKE05_06500 [Nanoarchaeota archaeon]|nr:hypothetical protein [Nanoarchaeota archaeon]
MAKASLHDHIRNREFMEGVDFRNLIRTVSKRLGENGIWGIVDWGDGRAERCFDGIKRAFPNETVELRGGSVFQVHPYKLWIVKGQEVPTKLNGNEVHVISLGIPQHKTLPAHEPIAELLKKAYETYGSIQNFDHPAGPRAGIIDAFGKDIETAHELLSLKGVNGWEVYNVLSASAPTLANFLSWAQRRLDLTNARSLKFYEDNIRRYHPAVGLTEGTDGHHVWESARAYFNVDINLEEPPETSREFIELLRSGIAGNKTYSGRCVTSFRGCAQHSAVIAWDHRIKPALGMR